MAVVAGLGVSVLMPACAQKSQKAAPPPPVVANAVPVPAVDAGPMRPQRVDTSSLEDESEAGERAEDEAKEHGKPVRTIDRDFTEAELLRFISYERQDIALARATSQKFAKARSMGQRAGGMTQMQALETLVKDAANQRTSDEAAARADAGIGESDVVLLRTLTSDVLAQRELARSPSLKKTLEQARRASTNMNPEQAPEAKADVGNLVEQARRMARAQDARDRYGDKNVELVLKHEAELFPLFEERRALTSKRP